MGKGEIARDEQFLLLPQCFQKASFPEASKRVIMWEWVSASKLKASSYHNLSVAQMSATFYERFEKHCGKKGENTGICTES